MTNSSFTLDKVILNNQKKSGETTYMSVKGNEQVKGMFEFLSKKQMELLPLFGQMAWEFDSGSL